MTIRLLFIRLLSIAWLVFLVACVMGEGDRRITEQNTLWIEKGRTTHEQVVTRFGEPSLTEIHQGIGQYTEYSVPSPVRLTLEPTQSGPLPQVHRSPIDTTISKTKTLGDRFWIIYDAQGIVEEFGFGSPPKR